MKIINGDCIKEIDRLIEEGIKVDAIITDPPYIISRKSWYINNAPDKKDYIKKYWKHTIDFWEWDKEELDIDTLLNKFYKILNDWWQLIMFYDVWKMQELKETAEKYKFKQPRLCQWVKKNPVPINSKLNYLTNAKEYFVTFTKKSKPTFNSEYDKWIYEAPICSWKERTKHPTQKPISIMEEIIKKHTNEWDIILDPFLWSWTTIVAAYNTNRECIWIEKSDLYYNMAKERIDNHIDIK